MAAFNESEPTQTLNSTISVSDDVNDIFLNPHLHSISQVEFSLSLSFSEMFGAGYWEHRDLQL